MFPYIAEGGAGVASGHCEKPTGQGEVGQGGQPRQGVTGLQGGREEGGCCLEGGRAGEEVPDHCPEVHQGSLQERLAVREEPVQDSFKAEPEH